jgi:Tetrahydrofolate dehydrogenase/cyclohydrolase, catalytic domain
MYFNGCSGVIASGGYHEGGVDMSQARIIDGVAVSNRLRDEVSARAAELAKQGVIPGLAVVLVGDDPASAVYVRKQSQGLRAAWAALNTRPTPGGNDRNAVAQSHSGAQRGPDRPWHSRAATAAEAATIGVCCTPRSLVFSLSPWWACAVGALCHAYIP